MSITEKAVDILTQSICKKNFKSLKEQAAQHTVIHWHLQGNENSCHFLHWKEPVAQKITWTLKNTHANSVFTHASVNNAGQEIIL